MKKKSVVKISARKKPGDLSGSMENGLLLPGKIAPFIHRIRAEKVILDRDLAPLYGVETRVLKQAVRRNAERFPEDFMFELVENEINTMVSQNVIPNKGVFGGAAPMAFTEQGVAMLSSVLRSPRAVEVNIAIVRTFVQLRKLMDSNRDLARKIEKLEDQYAEHDHKFELVFDAIKRLVAPPDNRKSGRRIGFHD